MPVIKSRRVVSISFNVLPNSDEPPKSLKMSRFFALKTTAVSHLENSTVHSPKRIIETAFIEIVDFWALIEWNEIVLVARLLARFNHHDLLIQPRLHS